MIRQVAGQAANRLNADRRILLSCDLIEAGREQAQFTAFIMRMGIKVKCMMDQGQLTQDQHSRQNCGCEFIFHRKV